MSGELFKTYAGHMLIATIAGNERRKREREKERLVIVRA